MESSPAAITQQQRPVVDPGGLSTTEQATEDFRSKQEMQDRPGITILSQLRGALAALRMEPLDSVDSSRNIALRSGTQLGK